MRIALFPDSGGFLPHRNNCDHDPKQHQRRHQPRPKISPRTRWMSRKRTSEVWEGIIIVTVVVGAFWGAIWMEKKLK